MTSPPAAVISSGLSSSSIAGGNQAGGPITIMNGSVVYAPVSAANSGSSVIQPGGGGPSHMTVRMHHSLPPHHQQQQTNEPMIPAGAALRQVGMSNGSASFAMVAGGPNMGQSMVPVNAGGGAAETLVIRTGHMPAHVQQQQQQQRMQTSLLTPSGSSKEWQRDTQDELRSHLVQKIIQITVPNASDMVFRDKRYELFINFAKKVEADTYSTANSRDDYYTFLAEKIYKIKREFEERTQRERQQQQQPGSLPNNMLLSNQENILNKLGGVLADHHLEGPQGSAGNPCSSASSSSMHGGSVPNHSRVQQQQHQADRLSHKSPGLMPPSLLTEVSINKKTPNAQTPGGNMPFRSLGGGELNNAPPSVPSTHETTSRPHSTQQQHRPQQRLSGDVKPDMDAADAAEQKAALVSEKQPDTPAAASVLQQTQPEPRFGSTHAPPVHRPPQQPPIKPNWKVFKPEELRDALMPTIVEMYQYEDTPMDLSTIQSNLSSGQYQDPWQYINDVFLMLENAWTYNRRTSKVYKCTNKICEVFQEAIDPVMQSLGYCCGRKYTFQPQVLCCYGRQLCTIPRDTNYYCYQNRYTFCERCFNEISGDSIELGDDPSQPQASILKSQFDKCKNDHVEHEPMVECKVRARKLHQICVLHMDQIWPGGFICDGCCKANNVTRKENRFTAKRLPRNKLSDYIEDRVAFLMKKDCEGGPIAIRLLSSCDKQMEVKPRMKQRYVDTGLMPESFPYRAKAIFAFEEFDGTDLCFLGMHVQEYDSNCPASNARRVYVAYIDSVFYFEPKERRTDVYHEILMAYFDYVKKLGYVYGHIWACPPSEGDDYIFHCHPPEQKMPKPKRLQEWYRKVLGRGILERVVHSYKDIATQATDENLKYAYELPYFDGDYWPNVLEECIKQVDQAQEEQEKQRRPQELESEDGEDLLGESRDKTAKEGATGGNGQKSSTGGGSGGNRNKKSKGAEKNVKNKSNTKNKSTTLHQDIQDAVAGKVFSIIKRHKEVFFVVRLHNQTAAAQLPPINDPDPLVACELMDGCNSFLTTAREKHLEFSSLRRAKFSSMAMLYELHMGGGDRFVYTCNNCRSQVETRYHCRECDDYDLCVACCTKLGHQHVMDKIGLDLDDGTGGGDGGAEGAGENAGISPMDGRQQSIEHWIQSLAHASQCKETSCRQVACKRMKHALLHTKRCKTKRKACPTCKQLLVLCRAHAKTCREQKCPVPLCAGIKQLMRAQTVQRQIQQEQLVRRRMAIMNMSMATAVSGSSSGGGGCGSSNNNNSGPAGAAQAGMQQQQNMPTTNDIAANKAADSASNIPFALQQKVQQVMRITHLEERTRESRNLMAANPILMPLFMKYQQNGMQTMRDGTGGGGVDLNSSNMVVASSGSGRKSRLSRLVDNL